MTGRPAAAQDLRDLARLRRVRDMQEPTDQPWGARDCAIRDPAGNTIRIQELR